MESKRGRMHLPAELHSHWNALYSTEILGGGKSNSNVTHGNHMLHPELIQSNSERERENCMLGFLKWMYIFRCQGLINIFCLLKFTHFAVNYLIKKPIYYSQYIISILWLVALKYLILCKSLNTNMAAISNLFSEA